MKFRLLTALVAELNAHGPPLPVYWGNRNWHPLLVDAVGQMAADGVRRALAFVTSAFGSYSGCRQYSEDIERARRQIGPDALDQPTLLDTDVTLGQRLKYSVSAIDRATPPNESERSAFVTVTVQAEPEPDEDQP